MSWLGRVRWAGEVGWVLKAADLKWFVLNLQAAATTAEMLANAKAKKVSAQFELEVGGNTCAGFDVLVLMCFIYFDI